MIPTTHSLTKIEPWGRMERRGRESQKKEKNYYSRIESQGLDWGEIKKIQKNRNQSQAFLRLVIAASIMAEVVALRRAVSRIPASPCVRSAPVCPV